MSLTNIPVSIQLGFLTVFPEGSGFVGGYLVTNSWGRPLEFRLSTAVQPNRIQQILYGRTMTEYLYADLIGKTLLDKSTTGIHLLLTDTPEAMPIRTRISVPVLGVLENESAELPLLIEKGFRVLPREGSSLHLIIDPQIADDYDTVQALFERIDLVFDLSEPFSRIREAMGEARKMGVNPRG